MWWSHSCEVYRLPHLDHVARGVLGNDHREGSQLYTDRDRRGVRAGLSTDFLSRGHHGHNLLAAAREFGEEFMRGKIEGRKSNQSSGGGGGVKGRGWAVVVEPA